MTVRAYIRMSTDLQAISPEAQRAAIAAWAQRAGVVVQVEHTDLGISGAAALDKRPGLLAALDALGKNDVLVIAKRDRLGRDALVLAMVEAAVTRKGARIVSAAGEGTEGEDPSHVLMRRIVDSFGEYERLLIKARTRAAMGVKSARGERVGSIPYGYALGSNGIHLVECPGEQEVIREARARRAAGLSLQRIAAALASKGMVSRSGRPFAPTQVSRMLSAPRTGKAAA